MTKSQWIQTTAALSFLMLASGCAEPYNRYLGRPQEQYGNRMLLSENQKRMVAKIEERSAMGQLMETNDEPDRELVSGLFIKF